MKRLLLLTVLAAFTITAAAQVQPSNSQNPAPKPGQSGQQPATTPTQATTPAPTAPTGGKPLPQAKSQDEFKAYQEAITKTTPADEENAADAFAAKFPESELRVLLYRKAMYDYQNINNADKTVDMARKWLAIDPNSPEALVTSATVIAQRTRETDLDRDERLNEATTDANKALQTVETDLIIPANAPPDRVQAYKSSIRAMAYDALGTVAMSKKDYPQAEVNLRKSAEVNAQPDAVTYLRLSVALDQQKKYAEALEAANKAVQYSADSPQANNLAKTERDRLQKLVNSPPPAATPAPPPTSPSPAPVPSSPGTQPSTQPSKPPQG